MGANCSQVDIVCMNGGKNQTEMFQHPMITWRHLYFGCLIHFWIRASIHVKVIRLKYEKAFDRTLKPFFGL